MTHISRKRTQFFIFLADLTLLLLAIPITLFLRKFQIPEMERVFEHLVSFVPIIAFWGMLMYGSGLYSLENPYRGFHIIVKMSAIGVVTLLFGFAEFYLFLGDIITPKTVLVIYCLLSFVLLMLWRTAYNYFFGVRRTSPKIAFIGNNETVRSLIAEMKRFSYFSFTPFVVYDPNPDNSDAGNVTFFSDSKAFSEFLETKRLGYCVLAREKEFPMEIRQELFMLLGSGVVFYSLPDFYEMVTRRIPIGTINDTWLLSHLDAAPRFGFDGLKRLFDLLISSLILALTALFWPIIALLIKLESPGPVFFRQQREGRGGKAFSILKFRTMRVEGNTYKPTGTNDNRITALGNFMRKTRIDEVPQVINVFRGDMSLIGPRPERPEIAVDLEKTIPYYRQRLIVKPGITGWDQVSGEYHSPSIEDTYKKLQLDLYYIKNRSVLLDISIFFKTITTVLKRTGR